MEIAPFAHYWGFCKKGEFSLNVFAKDLPSQMTSQMPRMLINYAQVNARPKLSPRFSLKFLFTDCEEECDHTNSGSDLKLLELIVMFVAIVVVYGK